jgi:hypothetical protein
MPSSRIFPFFHQSAIAVKLRTAVLTFYIFQLRYIRNLNKYYVETIYEYVVFVIYRLRFFYYYLVCEAIGTAATPGPIVSAPDDR